MSNKKAYVVGSNVSKSLSPTIFKYWFNKYNIDAEYGYIEVKEEMGFFKHVFNFDEESKGEMLNIIQYCVMAFIPIILVIQ